MVISICICCYGVVPCNWFPLSIMKELDGKSGNQILTTSHEVKALSEVHMALCSKSSERGFKRSQLASLEALRDPCFVHEKWFPSSDALFKVGTSKALRTKTSSHEASKMKLLSSLYKIHPFFSIWRAQTRAK